MRATLILAALAALAGAAAAADYATVQAAVDAQPELSIGAAMLSNSSLVVPTTSSTIFFPTNDAIASVSQSVREARLGHAPPQRGWGQARSQ